MSAFNTALNLLFLWFQLALILLAAGVVVWFIVGRSRSQPDHESTKPQFIHKLLSTVRRWRRRKACIRELKALNDRALEDIGLRRWEIDSVVDKLLSSAPPSKTCSTISREKILTPQNQPAIDANDNESKLAA